MRIHGNLTKWNDDRGFGFISSPQNTDEIFVHISAFPRDGERPKVGELISFEIDTEKSGKVRAVRVLRLGSVVRKRNRESQKAQSNVALFKLGFTFVLILVLAYIGYNYYISQKKPNFLAPKQSITDPVFTGQNFKCDGRQHCNQMTSRAEAEYFLKYCPNTKMDGDYDGIPCENDSRF